MIQALVSTRQSVSTNSETVVWMVQPDGVVDYYGSSGKKYSVRNKGESVVINKADRPGFETLGYINPQ